MQPGIVRPLDILCDLDYLLILLGCLSNTVLPADLGTAGAEGEEDHYGRID